MKQLDTHLYEQGARDELRHLINYIARAVKYVSHAIQIGNDLGLAGSNNSFGENQLALDVLSDRIIEENLMVCRLVKMAISEEKEIPVYCECSGDSCTSRYSVAYDPLDGSSLVDANLSIGSIFSIVEGDTFIGKTGRDQVAALFVVYGPRTTLTYTVGNGTHEFTLNDVGEFEMTDENIKLQSSAQHFAPGNLRAITQNEKYKAIIHSYMDEQYTLRYSGGMAPDINHMLVKRGGIFMYPAYEPKYSNGKLRLLFECNPFSFIVEQAGGASHTGEMPVMEVEVKEFHQRTPIFVGSQQEVEKVVDALKN